MRDFGSIEGECEWCDVLGRGGPRSEVVLVIVLALGIVEIGHWTLDVR